MPTSSLNQAYSGRHGCKVAPSGAPLTLPPAVTSLLLPSPLLCRRAMASLATAASDDPGNEVTACCLYRWAGRPRPSPSPSLTLLPRGWRAAVLNYLSWPDLSDPCLATVSPPPELVVPSSVHDAI